jgi:non-ribosomal peptide synthetase component F
MRSVVETNEPPAPRPPRSRPPTIPTVPDLLAWRAGLDPDATAVQTYGVSGLTFGEWQIRARIAAALQARGVGRGDRVGLLFGPRTWTQFAVAYCATHLVGAVAVPISDRLAAPQVEYVLDHCAVTATVHDEAIDPAVVARWRPVTLTELLTDSTSTVDNVVATSTDLAQILYTSGTPGRPKGIAATHANLVNGFVADRRRLGLAHSDTFLHAFPVGTNAAQTMLLTALTARPTCVCLPRFTPLRFARVIEEVTGGTTVIAADYRGLDGHGLVAFIAEQGVTHVQATPSGWRILLEAGFGDAERPVVALVGGEALPAPLAAQLRPRVRRLVNVYGPTETTVWATTGDVPPQPERIDIGTPLANLRVHVLDSALRPVPVGVPGEICIAGAGMANGYLGRPGLTAERFSPDPYGPAGGRLYRTGDIGYWDSDGRLVCQGRADNQVKLRGNRIELGEIEARLAAAPGVEQAVVALHGQGEDARLVGYVVGTNDVAALRDHLSRYLTPVMIPTAWVFLDALPLNANGKVDRRSLPEPAPSDAPRTSAPLD